MRDRYHDITARGADVAAIGTGDVGYAEAFARDERLPFPVLVDDDAAAARAASVRTVSFPRLLHPSTYRRSREAWRNGYRVHKSGRRVTQLGATFVIAPGGEVRYEHIDADSTDHAPLDEVLSALR